MNALRSISYVRSEEGSRTLLMMLLSAVNGFFTAFLFSTGNALFLEHHAATRLPWAYVSAAVVGYLAVTLFTRLERRLRFRQLLLVNVLALVAVPLLGWMAYRASPEGTARAVVAFVLLTVVGPAMVLLELGFWGLAARLFDLRQGKRLFGLISIGEVTASILGFSVLVPWLLDGRLADTSDLLLGSVVAMAAAGAVLEVVARRFRGEVATTREPSKTDEPVRDSLAERWRDPYFKWICAVMLLYAVAFYLVDLSFMSQVRGRSDTSRDIATFLGYFLGAVKLVELLMRATSGRLLVLLGVRGGLLALPVCLTVLCAGGLATGIVDALGPEHAFFLAAVVGAKGAWLVLRKSLFDPSVRVLYQPLPVDDRLAFQGQAGRVAQLGDLVIALVLAVCGSQAGFEALWLLFFALPAFVGLLVVAHRLHHQYRAKLESNLVTATREALWTPAERVADKIRNGPPEEMPFLFRILEQVDPTAVEPLLCEKLAHVLPQVRNGILRRIRTRRAYGTFEAVERCVAEALPAIRETAEETLASLTALRELGSSPKRFEREARSADPEERKAAAIAIGWTRHPEGTDEIAELLWDREVSVRRAALLAAGRLGDPRFWPQVLSHLQSPSYVRAATRAVLAVGEPILAELDLLFRRLKDDLGLRLRLLNVYQRIGGSRARLLLRDKLKDPEKAIRNKALTILSELGEVGGAVDPVLEVGHEIEQTVRTIAWDMAAVLDLEDDPRTARVCEALEGEIAQGKSTLFLLLALLYDPRTVAMVRESVEDEAAESTVYALELLDLVLAPEWKPLVFPLLEDVGYRQCVRRLDHHFLVERGLDPVARLEAALHRAPAQMGSWTKACALEALGELAKDVPPTLLAALHHPDPILQELAALNLHRIDGERFLVHLAKLGFEARERLERKVAVQDDAGPGSTLFDRVNLLARSRTLAGLSWGLLLRVAEMADELRVPVGARLPFPDDPAGTLYVVAEGVLSAPSTSVSANVLSTHSVVAARPTSVMVEVVEPCRLLRLDGDALLDLMAEHTELVPAVLEAGVRLSALEAGSMSLSSQHSSILASQTI